MPDVSEHIYCMQSIVRMVVCILSAHQEMHCITRRLKARTEASSLSTQQGILSY